MEQLLKCMEYKYPRQANDKKNNHKKLQARGVNEHDRSKDKTL